MIVAYIV